MSSRKYKIWGVKQRIYESDKCEIDILYLLEDSFCSTHSHNKKYNKFFVLAGRVAIETNYGRMVLGRGEESPNIKPSTMHRFFALEDAVAIETAYVKRGKIDSNDIERKGQGGRIIEGKEYTEKQLKKKGLLDSNKELGKIKEKLF